MPVFCQPSLDGIRATLKRLFAWGCGWPTTTPKRKDNNSLEGGTNIYHFSSDRAPGLHPRHAVLLVLLAVIAAAPLACSRKAPQPSVTIAGRTWQVEVADTSPLRQAGLSNRHILAPDHGMLFVYPRPRPLSFWMKDCYISLDIAFISADMKVVSMATMPAERDRAGNVLYNSDGAVQYALEAPAGALAQAGVKVGDTVEFSGVPPATKAQDDP